MKYLRRDKKEPSCEQGWSLGIQGMSESAPETRDETARLETGKKTGVSGLFSFKDPGLA